MDAMRAKVHLADWIVIREHNEEKDGFFVSPVRGLLQEHVACIRAALLAS